MEEVIEGSTAHGKACESGVLTPEEFKTIRG
jgi:hypothetical protein